MNALKPPIFPNRTYECPVDRSWKEGGFLSKKLFETKRNEWGDF